MENVVLTMRRETVAGSFTAGRAFNYLLTIKADGVEEFIFQEVGQSMSVIGFTIEALRDFAMQGIEPVVLDPDNVLKEFRDTGRGRSTNFGKMLEHYIPSYINAPEKKIASKRNYNSRNEIPYDGDDDIEESVIIGMTLDSDMSFTMADRI